MFFRSFFDEKLAHMSYLVGCQKTGEAIIIDPARDLTAYLETSKKEGLSITAIAETHIHADYLSGAKEAADVLGATLYLSDEGADQWKYEYASSYPHQLLKEKDSFSIGNIGFEVLHTPGHTPESISFLLTDKGGGAHEPMGLFSGDFLFVGDVGRPDLLEKVAGARGNSAEGAKQMFHSLQKMNQLPDFLQVWPAHGAGSACGKSLGAVPMTTLGYEKKYNWAFQINDEASFIEELLSGQPEAPRYFAQMKKWNKEGPKRLSQNSIERVETVPEKQLIVDTRPAEEFAKNHLATAINIPLNKSFPNWAGWIIQYEEAIYLISDENEIAEVVRALQSIGLDSIKGYMTPADALKLKNLKGYEEVEVEQANSLIQDDKYYLLDVRNQNEWDRGHIKEAHHLMLGHLRQHAQELPKDKTIITQCQSGARAAIGASLLQSEGFKVMNMKGGFSEWEKKDLPVEK